MATDKVTNDIYRNRQINPSSCVCVCMYVRMYVCLYVRTYVCMYVCRYLFIYGINICIKSKLERYTLAFIVVFMFTTTPTNWFTAHAPGRLCVLLSAL